MRPITKSDIITAFALMIIAGVMLFVSITVVNNEYSHMYRVEFLENQEIAIVWCDRDGVVKATTTGSEHWKERVVINVDKLVSGDHMQAYDLYSDLISPEYYEVLSVENR